MKKICILLLFMFLQIYGQNDTIKIEIFKNSEISFGNKNWVNNIKKEDKGRIISKDVNFPVLKGSYKVIAKVRLKSLGDPWDRFGSIWIDNGENPPIEIFKFMTGFGIGLPYIKKNIPSHPSVKKWAEYAEWEEDITNLFILFKGKRTIKAMIDTWVNPGWSLDFSLLFIKDDNVVNPDWIYSLINTTGKYFDYRKFEDSSTIVDINIPDNVKDIKMVYYTSGHGGVSTGDEFNKKMNVIYIDNKEVLRFIPWRDDCDKQFRALNPTSAKWEGDIWSSDLSRSNWCPGDKVYPMVFDMDYFLKPGKHQIRFDVEDQSRKGQNFWNISAYLVGYINKKNITDAIDTLYPYLQTPTSNSIYICWTYNKDNSSFVKFGKNKDSLTNIVSGSNEVIGGKYVWHFVKLEDLEPDTKYFYYVQSGKAKSNVYSFRTQPVEKKGNHIRIAIVGDNRTYPEKFREVLLALKEKVIEKYQDINDINVMLNLGDVITNGSGNIEQFWREYFEPMKCVSPYIPTQISIGNHEGEIIYLYQIMKNDEFPSLVSDTSFIDGYNKFLEKRTEKYYSFMIGKVLFIAINSNIHSKEQLEWLHKLVEFANSSKEVGFVIPFCHHPAYVENLRPDGISYMRDEVYPILIKLNKPYLVLHGHTHDYEIGELIDAPLRWMIIGNSGAELQYIKKFDKNQDLDLVRKMIVAYGYGLLDINLDSGKCTFEEYSIGNDYVKFDNKLIDHFVLEFNSKKPDKPKAKGIKKIENSYKLIASVPKREDKIISAEYQLLDFGRRVPVVFDVKQDIMNVMYDDGPPNFSPIDWNKDKKINEFILYKEHNIVPGKYFFRIRYRNKDLKWSNWSDLKEIEIKDSINLEKDYKDVKEKAFFISDYVPKVNLLKIDNKLHFNLESAKNAKFLYSINNKSLKKYINGNIILPDSGKLSLFFSYNGYKFDIGDLYFINHLGINQKIAYIYFNYSKKYPGTNNDNSLFDGLLGDNHFFNKAFQGFEAQDMYVKIEFDTLRNINEISLRFLQDIDNWIFLPKSIDIAYSQNGKDIQKLQSIDNKIPENKEGSFIHTFSIDKHLDNVKFLLIRARNINYCPEWHIGAGGKAWIFTDEIIIK